MATPLALEVTEVRKSFRNRAGREVVAVEATSLTVPSGQFVSLVGPSGCGKSTLLNMAAGLLRPSSGQVRVLGGLVEGPRPDVGYMQQDPMMLPWRTVMKNVMLPYEVGRRQMTPDRIDVAHALLETVGLGGFESSYPRELSGGMMQRASLVRTLIFDPEILLMDEPFAALDAFTREAMGAELLRLWEGRDVSVVFVTHNIEEAVFLSDRVVVMSARPGRIIEDIQIELARPRTTEAMLTEAFTHSVRQVRSVLDSRGVLDRGSSGH